MQVHDDKWLSDIFGYPCYKLTGEGDVPKLEGKCFAWARVSTLCTPQVNALIDCGFRLVSTNIELMVESIKTVFRPWKNRVYPVSAVEGEEEYIGGIAAEELDVNRFTLDPKIPPDIARSVKRKWAIGGAKGERGAGMMVAKMRNSTVPCGFLLFDDSPQGGVVIDLMGVNRYCRRRGVGRSMLEYLVCMENPQKITATTDIKNLSAIGFYEKMGFRNYYSFYVLHYHGEP